MFADTFDATNISEYTTTGTVAVTDNVLEVIQGKKSLKITHTGGASAERIIPVDIKFRNKNVTFSFDVESNALSGNLTLTVTDNTNTVTLVNAESIQPQGTLDTSIKRSVSFIIPDDCEELKYKFTAVSESGKISIIDNVVIELTQTAKLSTTIEVPVVTEEVNAGAITITATTTNPTKGTTSTDNVFWHREGQFLVATYRYAQTSTGSAGSGDYLFTIPNSLQVDTSQIIPYTGAVNTNISQRSIIGTGTRWDSGPTHAIMHPTLYSATQFRIRTDILYSSVSFMSSTNTPLNLAGVTFTVSIKVPIVGWSATETQEVSLTQAVLKQESDSQIKLNTANGYGSTGTFIRRFLNTLESTGDSVTYIDSAINGSSFVINEDGVYNISYTDNLTGVNGRGISLNASITTQVASLPVANVLAVSAGSALESVSWQGTLKVGDIIRPHTDGSASAGFCIFTISKAGSLKQVNVTENQRIEIPTSELRMEGSTTRGTGSDSAIVRFDNIAKLRGDAFTVESTAALGTVITMKKKGKLDINLSLNVVSSSGRAQITLNQSIRTLTSGISSEILADSHTSSASNLPPSGMTASLFVNIGDVIRVASTLTPAVAAGNNLALSFQEQEIAVSVTNVLPQFSESDSSVRVDTANGYGSPTGTRIRRFSNVRDNLGSAITYVPSATDGDSFVINEDSVYNIHYNESVIGNSYFGITKNASSLSTNIISTPMSQRLAMEFTDNSTGSYNVGWNGYLQKGDIIRAHTDGGAASSGQISFAISKVGKPNVTGVDVTPFAKIEYEVTQAIELRTANGFGSTYTGVARLSTVLKNTNTGLLRYEDSVTLGGSITVLKPCKMNIDASGNATSPGSIFITRNSTIFTPTPPDNIISQTSSPGSSVASNIAVEITVNAGDVIRIQKDSGGFTGVGYVNIIATELRDAYQVIGGGVENTYSAPVTSAAAITSQSYPFIASVTKGGTGIYNVNFVPGFFTSAPFCSAAFGQVATGVISNAGVTQVTDITTSGCIVRTFNTSFSPLDLPFTLKVERQGSDYRTPSKAIGLPQQRIAYLYENIASGAASGSIVASTWTNRRLDQILDSTGLVTSLASNQFTLPVGKYSIDVSGVMYFAGNIVFRLRNITDSTTSFVTSNAFSGGSTVAAPVYGSFEVTLTSPKTFAVQYFADGTGGGGVAYAGQVTSGESTRPTLVKIVKVEE
jgi:hypothetical protein